MKKIDRHMIENVKLLVTFLHTLLYPKACLHALWVSNVVVFYPRIYHQALLVSSIENDSLGSDKKLSCHDLCKNNKFTLDDFQWVVYWPKETQKHVVNIKQVLFYYVSIFYNHSEIKVRSLKRNKIWELLRRWLVLVEPLTCTKSSKICINVVTYVNTFKFKTYLKPNTNQFLIMCKS